jgi:hypothetical protein
MIALAITALAGCGSHAARPLWARACGAAARAAHGSLRVTSRDPGDVECEIDRGPLRAALVVQPSARAYTEFDTTSSHYSQVFGNGPVHDAADQPVPVPGLGVAAVWVPAARQLVATNAGPAGGGGTYLTVTIAGGGRAAGRRRAALAVAVGRAALRVSPLPSQP